MPGYMCLVHICDINLLAKRFTKFGRFMSVDGVRERTIDVEGLRTRYLTAGDDGGRRWSCFTAWVPARASGPGCCPVWRLTTASTP